MTQHHAELSRQIDGGPRSKIVVLVQHGPHGVRSYSWRIWAGKTSFYIKPRHAPVAGFKVSLHGPRTRGPSFWKVESDRRDLASAEQAGGVPLNLGDHYRETFRGRRVIAGVRLAVRIRHPWTAFRSGFPTGPDPGPVRRRDADGAFFGCLEAPGEMRFADIDIYVSERGTPFWRDEAEARERNARVGWLENEAGQHLTAIAYSRGLAEPTPPQLPVLRLPTQATDAIRSVSLSVVRNVLWIQEDYVSKLAFESYRSEGSDSVDASST